MICSTLFVFVVAFTCTLSLSHSLSISLSLTLVFFLSSSQITEFNKESRRHFQHTHAFGLFSVWVCENNINPIAHTTFTYTHTPKHTAYTLVQLFIYIECVYVGICQNLTYFSNVIDQREFVGKKRKYGT